MIIDMYQNGTHNTHSTERDSTLLIWVGSRGRGRICMVAGWNLYEMRLYCSEVASTWVNVIHIYDHKSEKKLKDLFFSVSIERLRRNREIQSSGCRACHVNFPHFYLWKIYFHSFDVIRAVWLSLKEVNLTYDILFTPRKTEALNFTWKGIHVSLK